MSDERPIDLSDPEPSTAPRPKTHAIFLLDKSGSMRSCRAKAIQFFNEQVQALLANTAGIDTYVSLFVFAGNYTITMWNEPISDKLVLREEDYIPEGGTALCDAMGNALSKARELEGFDDPTTAFLVEVVSDGEENQSRKFTKADIAKLVAELSGSDRWTFVYLGANQNMFSVQQEYQFAGGNTMDFNTEKFAVASMSTASATRSYMQERARGVRSVKNFYNRVDDAVVEKTDALRKAVEDQNK